MADVAVLLLTGGRGGSDLGSVVALKENREDLSTPTFYSSFKIMHVTYVYIQCEKKLFKKRGILSKKTKTDFNIYEIVFFCPSVLLPVIYL